eukprot:7475475-Lingulodinium_polyedra.AAC.1
MAPGPGQEATGGQDQMPQDARGAGRHGRREGALRGNGTAALAAIQGGPSTAGAVPEGPGSHGRGQGQEGEGPEACQGGGGAAGQSSCAGNPGSAGSGCCQGSGDSQRRFSSTQHSSFSCGRD